MNVQPIENLILGESYSDEELARGFLRGKKISLLDEGTSIRDEKSRLDIEQQLVVNKECTVLMMTHPLRAAIRDKMHESCVIGAC